jgi:trimethylamine--corrinoid protein Co-methyltransferase
MDVDRCGMMQRLMAGLMVDDKELAADAFREIGPGGNFLGAKHTVANFATANYMSDIADTNSYEQWRDDGAKDAVQRAYERWTTMLKAYEAPAIEPSVDEALNDFMDKKKHSMADQWY